MIEAAVRAPNPVRSASARRMSPSEMTPTEPTGGAEAGSASQTTAKPRAPVVTTSRTFQIEDPGFTQGSVDAFSMTSRTVISPRPRRPPG